MGLMVPVAALLNNYCCATSESLVTPSGSSSFHSVTAKFISRSVVPLDEPGSPLIDKNGLVVAALPKLESSH